MVTTDALQDFLEVIALARPVGRVFENLAKMTKRSKASEHRQLTMLMMLFLLEMVLRTFLAP